MADKLRVVIIKPSKYDIDGTVERFRWGFMPNSTDDPKVPDGYYVSQTEDGVKTTNVYDKDDNLVGSHPDDDDE